VSIVTTTASSDVFRAIADPTRRALLDLLRTGDRTVNELAEPFDMSRPAISQHLRLLLESRLVSVKKEGRQRRYRLNQSPIGKVARWAGKFEDAGKTTARASGRATSKTARKAARKKKR
jgi:DNA-binding transcriptional ArsR family regulator